MNNITDIRNHSSAWSPSKTAKVYNELVRPTFVDNIRPLGLDVVFHRAAADYLYYYDQSGAEVAVLDMVGGSGATILGHNHPALLAYASELLEEQIPFHGQRSIRGFATKLAAALNDILQEETNKSYVLTYANSGSEANELAVKHAHFERQALRDKWAEHVMDPALPADARHHNEKVLASGPVFVAVEDGFHGKTNASLALSYSQAIKVPSLDLMQPTVHLKANSLRDLGEKLADHETKLFHVRNGQISELPYTPVIGIICEPILGDGGIVELHEDYLRALRAWASRFGIPLIFDEIQSGMGRSGNFLASSASNVTGDYYTFSKALSGGIGKVSLVAIEADRFIEHFALVHSSTYNEDDWSCAIALKTLTLLKEIDVCRLAGERGRDIGDRLMTIAARYPGLVTGVRGRGLMLGIEWNPDMEALVPAGAHLAQFIEGALFTDYQVRVGTAIATPYITRLTPSALISDESVDRFADAIEALCNRLSPGQRFRG